MATDPSKAAERSPRLRVFGKGNEPRGVLVGPEGLRLSTVICMHARSLAGRRFPACAFFVRRVTGAYVAFYRQAMDALGSAGTGGRGSLPHRGRSPIALRHRYATLLVDAGASLPEVQRLPGHASLSTTQVYLKLAGRGLEEAALANPARALMRKLS